MPNTPAKILYIDDDPALGRLVQKVLGRQGRDIIHVTGADDGLERLKDGDIDVLVLDHYLADRTGLAMLEEVAAREDSPPVVYVTGSTEAAIAVAALKAGAADYVLKTVGEDFLELLSNAIEQAIETSRLRKARERAEREMREARERAELALAEVNHRVANSLALVAALVRLQMSAVTDPAAKEALAETQGRISAIAGIHKRLYTTDDVRFVEIDAYLGNLASDIQATMSLDGSAADIRLLAEPLRLPTDKAVSVGVIVNELVTNAAKYAYRDREAGEIRVKASQIEPGKIEIVVEDDGIGWMGEGKIHGTGVGSRVIAATASGLGATLAYENVARGTRARLQIEI
ncbi:histidine kinase dimerization/phosphoacceptor domain -containing protein [Pelagibacterium sp. H642]|uniref:histidine kinase dimerization/phosphoacceptor domain -containing protein n=1 Tax=Pelagibacterium sp. H642 TaxID=1881069 RepID=UPI002815AB05|nr:histidine kinase dimerization/phosphoacceptor domain -containing protein [Pelagibacterium sp. H642]WMT91805.1 response regulator [Pelagibacterium sp. H642]